MRRRRRRRNGDEDFTSVECLFSTPPLPRHGIGEHKGPHVDHLVDDDKDVDVMLHVGAQLTLKAKLKSDSSYLRFQR